MLLHTVYTCHQYLCRARAAHVRTCMANLDDVTATAINYGIPVPSLVQQGIWTEATPTNMDRDTDRGRIFSVPPLEEIKKARSVSYEKGPTLFKSTRSKESSSVNREPTGASGGPDVKQGGLIIGNDRTKGGGTILQKEISSKQSVGSHTHGSSNPRAPRAQAQAGKQTSAAGSSIAGSGSSHSGSLMAGGQAYNRSAAESNSTGLNQLQQQQDDPTETTRAGAGGLTGGSRAGAGGLTGGSRAGAGGFTGAGGLTWGSRESDSTVSRAGESSSSASATTAAPIGSHHHPHAILTNPVQVRSLIPMLLPGMRPLFLKPQLKVNVQVSLRKGVGRDRFGHFIISAIFH